MGRTADSLVDAVILDVWPSTPVVIDFGITDQEHYEALYYPIRNGEINADQLQAVVCNGPEITKLVAGCASTKRRNLTAVFKTMFDDMGEIDE